MFHRNNHHVLEMDVYKRILSNIGVVLELL